MGSKNLTLIFATIVLHLFLHFPSQTEADAQLVSKVCKQSENYNSCVRILTSYPETLAARTVKEIAEKSLELARKDAADTSNFFTGLANKNPASKPALVQCASHFKEAISFLNLKGLEGGTASLDVHYALDEAEYCETGLSKGHVRIASATARIQKWKDIFSAAYATVITLEK